MGIILDRLVGRIWSVWGLGSGPPPSYTCSLLPSHIPNRTSATDTCPPLLSHTCIQLLLSV